MNWLSADANGVVLALRVVPRASKNEVCGEMEGALKIRLQAPPVEGKANKALIRWLADKLEVPTGRVAILRGETGRHKRVRIEGVTQARALKALLGQP